MLNGHEYVACQAQKAAIDFSKQDNCFTMIPNAADLAKVADTLSRDEIAGRLLQLCERWIYTTCLCFALDLEEQKKSRFQYQYSVFQIEYSRNLLFQSGRQMDQIFQALIDRTRAPLNLDRLKTIFGDKHRPHYDKRKKNPTRWGVVVEKPTYDVTIFKVHYGKMTLKIYTKGERVLRIEVIVHNTKEYRWGRSLPCFPEIVLRLRGILDRFLNAVGCMDACFVSDNTLETLPQPAHVGQTKVGGIDLNKPRMRRVADALLALASSPTGFTASDLAEKIRAMSGESDSAYGARRDAYDIEKLRGKGMVLKIGASRRYEPIPEGLRALTALVVLREKVIRPLLAASTRPEPHSKLSNPTPIDQHYENLRAGMRGLFTELGVAAYTSTIYFSSLRISSYSHYEGRSRFRFRFRFRQEFPSRSRSGRDPATRARYEELAAGTAKRANDVEVIPRAEGLARLLRAEAATERNLNRAIDRLEYLQRCRQGKSVPLPLKVGLSAMLGFCL
jgi:hypothetical protein